MGIGPAALAIALALPLTPPVPAQPAGPAGVAAAVERRLTVGHVPAAAYAIVEDGEVRTGGHGDGVSADTPFVLGSLSKSFTAVAVLLLVERGAVGLDRPVTAYLPLFRTAGSGAVPTVRQLLDQTSGLPTRAGVADLGDTGRTLSERVRDIATVRPTAAPGERFQYCNLNYATLGLLVQRVSGRSYADFLRAEVLAPLGMTRTFTSLPDARAAGLVPGTVPWFGVPVRRQLADFPGALPDGYLVSTANDLARYLRMLLGGGGLLAPATLALMRTTSTATEQDAAAPGTDGYGLGLATGTTAGGERLVAHEGDVPRCWSAARPRWRC